MTVKSLENFHLPAGPKHLHFERNRASSRRFSIAALSLGVLLFALSGCSVNEHKNGDAENVHLHTPLGGLDVRTNSAAAVDVGVPLYPGAVATGDHGNDSGAADIHMSFGKWQLNVKAAEYQSKDPEFKLVAFYKKAMASYGDVLTCKDKKPLGQPVATSKGLTCANDHEYDVSMDAGSSKNHVNCLPPQKSPVTLNCWPAPQKINTSSSSRQPPTEQNSRLSPSSYPIKVKPTRHSHPGLDCDGCRLRPHVD